MNEHYITELYQTLSKEDREMVNDLIALLLSQQSTGQQSPCSQH